MTWQELIPVLVIFSSVVSILGSVPSSRREQDVRSVKTYRIPSNPGTTRTVTIADDRIEVVVSIDALAANRSRIIEQLGKLRGISRALDKRVQALEKMNHRDGFALLFPKTGTEDYVLFRGVPFLQAVTGCMWIQSSNKDTNGCPFSYAVSGSDNELLLYNHKNLALWVGGKSSSNYAGAVNDGRWHHICFTWENTAGSWNIYVDGTQKATGAGLNRGRMIRGGGVLMLGQEQDSVGGHLQRKQSFVGMMSQVNLWSRVLSGREIVKMSHSCRMGEGNVLKWSNFKYGIHGRVKVIEPSPCGP